MKRTPDFLLALLASLLVQAGCSSSVVQLRDQLDLHRWRFHQKLADKQELTTKFLACTGHAHDEPLSERRDADTSPEPLSLQTHEGQAMSVRPANGLQPLFPFPLRGGWKGWIWREPP